MALGGGVPGPVQGPVRSAFRLRPSGVPVVLPRTGPRPAVRAAPHIELTCAECRKCDGSNPPPSAAGWPSSPGSTAPASSTQSWPTPGRVRPPPQRAAESPTLARADPLQFEATLTAARLSPNPHDFALVAMLGLRIFQACGADIEHLGEGHGHRVLKVHGKGGKIVLAPLPPAVGRAIDRAVGDRRSGPILRTDAAPGWTGIAPPAGCTTSPTKPASTSPECTPHAAPHLRYLSRACRVRDVCFGGLRARALRVSGTCRYP